MYYEITRSRHNSPCQKRATNGLTGCYGGHLFRQQRFLISTVGTDVEGNVGLFNRKAPIDPKLANLKTAMRDAIRSRGLAQIPEATAVVGSHADQILADAKCSTNYLARTWLLDRMRFLIVTVMSPQLLEFLDGIPEFGKLKAEYFVLTTDYSKFGPEHLVAWWWHLNPDLFKPYIEAQLLQMEPILVEAVQGIASSGGDFACQMIEWNNFFG
jgi:hypothetical protein